MTIHGNAAFALDAGIHGGVGGAVILALETLGQQLHEGADGGHGPAAGDRVGVLQLVTPMGVDLAALAHSLQCFAGAAVGVPEQRRGLALGLVFHRLHGVAKLRQVVALGAIHMLDFLGTFFHELRVQHLHQTDVQAIHPDHGFIGRIAMVVEAPGRRDHKVADIHGDFFAIDSGVGATALQDETQRRL